MSIGVPLAGEPAGACKAVALRYRLLLAGQLLRRSKRSAGGRTEAIHHVPGQCNFTQIGLRHLVRRKTLRHQERTLALLFDVRANHLRGEPRGQIAVLAFFDQHAHNDFRVAARSEPDKPAIIPVLFSARLARRALAAFEIVWALPSCRRNQFLAGARWALCRSDLLPGPWHW